MRNGQNNNKRMRNRNNNNNNNNNRNNNNRRGQNPMTRVFESNGPDIKIRGTASHVAEKYVQLARDARSSGDPVAAENYYQHAEHYFRLIAAAQEQFRQNQPQPRTETKWRRRTATTRARASRISARSPASCRRSRSPSCRATIRRANQREGQPYQPREQRDHQPREQREHQPREHREHRPQPQFQPPQPQPQPVIADGQRRSPAVVHHRSRSRRSATAPAAFEGGERFPRRRRRPHGPRPEGAAAPAAPERRFQSGE